LSLDLTKVKYNISRLSEVEKENVIVWISPSNFSACEKNIIIIFIIIIIVVVIIVICQHCKLHEYIDSCTETGFWNITSHGRFTCYVTTYIVVCNKLFFSGSLKYKDKGQALTTFHFYSFRK
jgi:hypothetical protein